MPRRRAGRQREEILRRTIRVDSVQLSLSRRVDKPRGAAPVVEDQCWIELRGEADEALRDVQQFVVSLHLEERKEAAATAPPSVGAIIQVRPEVQAIVGLEDSIFDRTWTLATSKELRYCGLAFTRPVRRYAQIVSVSFSNEEEE